MRGIIRKNSRIDKNIRMILGDLYEKGIVKQAIILYNERKCKRFLKMRKVKISIRSYGKSKAEYQ